jgi:crotonobetainyl-CoA:carnitine CoA-transferase CaiB-like acyl-CoA transferase
MLTAWRRTFKGKSSDSPPDLVLDGRPPGVTPLGEIRPTLRITPFGEAGPWAGWRGSELVHQAMSGLMALDGYDADGYDEDDGDVPPVMCAGGQAEVVGGLLGAIGGLLAVLGAGGPGQPVATSWHEALSVGHETEFAAWTARGERLLRHTGQHASHDRDPRRWQWPTSDGRYVNLIMPALTRDRWASLLDWLNDHGMAADLNDERWQKGATRLAEERHIFEVLGAFAATLPADWLFQEGQARDLPWGVVRRPEENLAEPQFLARPVFASLPAAVGMPWRVHVGDGPSPAERRRRGVQARGIQGLRVLDFTWQVMGPTVTRILAHAGADVVKVERPGKPELMRVMPVGSSAVYGSGEGSPFFANLNAGKRSIALDVSAERETVLRLAASCDVVVENFSSRVMERLGLSFDALQEANPSVVYVSLSGFGHEGPLRDYDTWGPTAQALSGLTYLSGLPGRPPAGFGFSYLDYVGGYFGVLGALAAVWATRRDGRARWVDVSQVECGLVCASLALENPGVVTPGNDGPVVRAGDGRWVVGLDRVGHSAYDSVVEGQAKGAACGVVQDQADRLAHDRQLAWAGAYPLPYEATPIRVGGRVLPITRPAPRLGEHTEEVRAEWL